jgi:hypothetical protein
MKLAPSLCGKNVVWGVLQMRFWERYFQLREVTKNWRKLHLEEIYALTCIAHLVILEWLNKDTTDFPMQTFDRKNFRGTGHLKNVRKCEGNIKMNLREIVCEGVECIQLDATTCSCEHGTERSGVNKRREISWQAEYLSSSQGLWTKKIVIGYFKSPQTLFFCVNSHENFCSNFVLGSRCCISPRFHFSISIRFLNV